MSIALIDSIWRFTLQLQSHIMRACVWFALRSPSGTANVGARRLKTVVAKLLEDVKFDAHKMAGQRKCTRWYSELSSYMMTWHYLCYL